MSSFHTDRPSIPITIHLSYLSQPVAEPLTKQVSYMCSVWMVWMLWCLEIITNNSLLDNFLFWFDIIKLEHLRTKLYLHVKRAICTNLTPNTQHEIKFVYWGWSPIGSTQHCGHQWPIVPDPGDYDDGEIGGMIDRGNRNTWRKPALVTLCPPQTLHAARTRTRAAVVGSQRLTAWATARPRHEIRNV
jgi:hypothetical protein